MGTYDADASERLPWWKQAVIYHIYPRSFQDTNGDGAGDLPGITSRLAHIRDLGADAIWMGPVFASPQVDNGYDISDYRAIDPLFGTLEEMDRLIERAHELGIRVLLDLVFNHTSDRHRWFTESRDDPAGPYGDWYIWRDEPNNWQSFFSVPAWTWSPERKQYYLHLFAPEQPDLNWENEAVRKALADTANYWLDRGVDGFRLDVINVISKKAGLPSLPEGTPPNGYFIDGPDAERWIREFRSRLQTDREILLVGETPGVSADAARRYTTPGGDGREPALDMVLLFEHLQVDHGPAGRWDPRPLRIGTLREVVSRWQQTLAAPAWPSIYLSNHDQPRVVSRYGNDGQYRYESATALATAFYLQRGTPIIYQGEEIAMRNYPFTSPDQIVDIESANAYRKMVELSGMERAAAFERVRGEARDNGRTPMQWSRDAHGGFTDGTPWFPVNPDFPDWNVAVQNRADATRPVGSSVLSYFRTLLRTRRENRAFLEGTFEIVPVDDDSPLFVFQRTVSGMRDGQGSTVLVIVNLCDHETKGPEMGDLWAAAVVVLGNYHDVQAGERIETVPHTLRPWEALVLARHDLRSRSIVP